MWISVTCAAVLVVTVVWWFGLHRVQRHRVWPHRVKDPKAKVAQPGARVRVLSYNIFMRPPFIRNNDDDFKNERLYEFERLMSDWDIICLQEFFTFLSFRSRHLLRAAYAMGFRYYVQGKGPDWGTLKLPMDPGLLILSRYPIVEEDAHVFTAGNQIDGWVAKQVIYARIQLRPGRQVHVFTSHLQASYYTNHDDVNAVNDAARLAQVQEYCHFVKQKVKDSPHPALITGDFNADARGVAVAVDACDGDAPEAPAHSDEYAFLMDCLMDIAEPLPLPGESLDSIRRRMVDHDDATVLHRTVSQLHLSPAQWLHQQHHVPRANDAQHGRQQVTTDDDADGGDNDSVRAVIPVVDLLHTTAGEHPVTYGAFVEELLPRGERVRRPSETVLTHPADHMCCLSIDYLFWRDTAANIGSGGLTIHPEASSVERFEHDSEHAFTQLSDHYAVQTVITVNGDA